MLVNASNSPGEFFRQTINGLCPGTTYEFSAYVVNVLKPSAAGNKPNLSFIIETIDGAPLGSYQTGNIIETSTPEWNKYGLIFTTTASTSQVVLKIINNAPGGNGNDLALDDITFRPCGPTIQTGINGSDAPLLVCEGQSSTLMLSAKVSGGYTNPAYQWQMSDNSNQWVDIQGANSSTSQVFLGGSSLGEYKYRLAVAESINITTVGCRVLSSPMTVTVKPKPVVNAGPDKSTMAGKPVILDGQTGGNNVSFLWSPSTYLDDPRKLNPIATPLTDIIYTLQVIDGCNMTVSDEVFVKVYSQIVIPNGFTPNGDGLNDLWNIAGLKSYSEALIKIFNRYGQVIFSSRGYEKPWDGHYKGRILPPGMYYYIIDLQNAEKIFSGSITIIK